MTSTPSNAHPVWDRLDELRTAKGPLPALEFANGPVSTVLTYEELHDRACRLACVLLDQAPGESARSQSSHMQETHQPAHGMSVLVVGDPGLTAIAVLACQRIGAVPIIVAPRCSSESKAAFSARVESAIVTCDASAILCCPQSWSTLKGSARLSRSRALAASIVLYDSAAGRADVKVRGADAPTSATAPSWPLSRSAAVAGADAALACFRQTAHRSELSEVQTRVTYDVLLSQVRDGLGNVVSALDPEARLAGAQPPRRGSADALKIASDLELHAARQVDQDSPRVMSSSAGSDFADAGRPHLFFANDPSAASFRDVHLDGLDARYLSAPRLPQVFEAAPLRPCALAEPRGSDQDELCAAHMLEPAPARGGRITVAVDCGGDGDSARSPSFASSAAHEVVHVRRGGEPYDDADGSSSSSSARSVSFEGAEEDEESTWQQSILSSSGEVGGRGASGRQQVCLLSALPVDVLCGAVFGVLLPLLHGWRVRVVPPCGGRQPGGKRGGGKTLWMHLLEAAVAGQLDAAFVRSVESDGLAAAALELSEALSEAGGDEVSAKLAGSPAWTRVGGRSESRGCLAGLEVFALFGPCLSPGSAQALLATLSPHGLRRTHIVAACTVWDALCVVPPLVGMHSSASGVRCAVGPAQSPLGLARVVDPMTRIPVQAGAVGEVWQLMSGSAPLKVAGPLSAHATLPLWTFDPPTRCREGPYLATGLAGYVENGLLFVVGRLQDLVLSQGRCHHATDIEAHLAAQWPSLRLGHVAVCALAAASPPPAAAAADGAGSALARKALRRPAGDVIEAAADAAWGLPQPAVVREDAGESEADDRSVWGGDVWAMGAPRSCSVSAAALGVRPPLRVDVSGHRADRPGPSTAPGELLTRHRDTDAASLFSPATDHVEIELAGHKRGPPCAEAGPFPSGAISAYAPDGKGGLPERSSAEPSSFGLGAPGARVVLLLEATPPPVDRHRRRRRASVRVLRRAFSCFGVAGCAGRRGDVATDVDDALPMLRQAYGIHVDRIICVPEGALPKTPLGDPDRSACCALHFAMDRDALHS